MGLTEGIILIVVAIIGSGSATAVVTALINRFGRGSPIKIGVRLLLQDKIEHLGMRCISEGKITYELRKYLNAAHECYHKHLHGNGDLDALMTDANELPVIYPTKTTRQETRPQ